MSKHPDPYSDDAGTPLEREIRRLVLLLVGQYGLRPQEEFEGMKESCKGYGYQQSGDFSLARHLFPCLEGHGFCVADPPMHKVSQQVEYSSDEEVPDLTADEIEDFTPTAECSKEEEDEQLSREMFPHSGSSLGSGVQIVSVVNGFAEIVRN